MKGCSGGNYGIYIYYVELSWLLLGFCIIIIHILYKTSNICHEEKNFCVLSLMHITSVYSI